VKEVGDLDRLAEWHGLGEAGGGATALAVRLHTGRRDGAGRLLRRHVECLVLTSSRKMRHEEEGGGDDGQVTVDVVRPVEVSISDMVV
jgi:hypothetical protein